MRFCATPVRRLGLLRAHGLLVLTVAFLVFPLLVPVDDFGRNFLRALAGGCLVLGPSTCGARGVRRRVFA